jgi:hypothetical protein
MLAACGVVFTSDTTRYGRKLKEKGKLQITEELSNGLRKTKVGCCTNS